MKNSLAYKLKQVPEGYLIVGIDPHQNKHAAVAMTHDFTTRCKFKFNNSREGYDTALERLREEMIKAGCKGIILPWRQGDITGETWLISSTKGAYLSVLSINLASNGDVRGKI